MSYVVVFYVNPPARWWGQGMLLDIRWSVVAATATFLGILIHKTGRNKGAATPNDPIIYLFWVFMAWLVLQKLWAIDLERQQMLVEYYFKFGIAVYLMLKAIDSEGAFRLFLWAHVLGCFYFGWLVYTRHGGGRFDEFGGAGVQDANEAALTIGTGAMALGVLLLSETIRRKAALVAMAPFLLNAIVATVSRSGFLAMFVGGSIFNLLTPAKFRKWVLSLSLLSVALFFILSNDNYWDRIYTITERGQEVEGMETGSERIRVMKAQLLMFKEHPWGCGHFCTTILSPQYLDASDLDSMLGVRSSHNTFLSMLVEQGLPGAVAYISLLLWVAARSLRLARQSRGSGSFVSLALPCVVGSLGAMFVADMFVPYVRFEVRFWFIGLLLILLRFQQVYGSKPNVDGVDGARS